MRCMRVCECPAACTLCSWVSRRGLGADGWSGTDDAAGCMRLWVSATLLLGVGVRDGCCPWLLQALFLQLCTVFAVCPCMETSLSPLLHTRSAGRFLPMVQYLLSVIQGLSFSSAAALHPPAVGTGESWPQCWQEMLAGWYQKENI